MKNNPAVLAGLFEAALDSTSVLLSAASGKTE